MEHGTGSSRRLYALGAKAVRTLGLKPAPRGANPVATCDTIAKWFRWCLEHRGHTQLKAWSLACLPTCCSLKNIVPNPPTRGTETTDVHGGTTSGRGMQRSSAIKPARQWSWSTGSSRRLYALGAKAVRTLRLKPADADPVATCGTIAKWLR